MRQTIWKWIRLPLLLCLAVGVMGETLLNALKIVPFPDWANLLAFAGSLSLIGIGIVILRSALRDWHSLRTKARVDH